MVLINDNSEELSNNWWLDVDSPLQLNVVVPHLTSLVPLSTVVGIPCTSILGGLESHGVDLSLLATTAAITSFLQRHRGDFEVLISWHVHLKPHWVVSLPILIVESRSGIQSWLDPVVVPFA